MSNASEATQQLLDEKLALEAKIVMKAGDLTAAFHQRRARGEYGTPEQSLKSEDWKSIQKMNAKSTEVSREVAALRAQLARGRCNIETAGSAGRPRD